MRWDQLWTFLFDKHILHTLLVLVLIIIILFPGRLKQIFGQFKKIKAGPLELHTDEEKIDSETPCPYTKSRDITFAALRDVDTKVDKLAAEIQEIIVIVKTMSIDQQKQLFYDTNQPAAERLAGGLKYVQLGGNGHSKKDIETFAEANKDIYNALTYVQPELRLIYE